MNEGRYSEEQLQAFIDDEIDVNDRAELMEAIRHDDELACRVCELLQIKDSVRLAYRETERRKQARNPLPAGRLPRIPLQAAAAVLIFALGTAAGLVMQQPIGGQAGDTGNLQAVGGEQQELKRVIFHISTENPDRIAEALNDAEELLVSYRDHPGQVQIEVVANAAGLSLLRSDTSPYPERIRQLVEQYGNIHFLACSRSVEKLQIRGIPVHLLPEARVIPGALEEIVDRMQEGWIYIRV